MALHTPIPNKSLVAIAWILFLSLTITCTFSARILLDLDDDVPQDDLDSPLLPGAAPSVVGSPATSLVAPTTNPAPGQVGALSGQPTNPAGSIGAAVGPTTNPAGTIGAAVGPTTNPAGTVGAAVGPTTNPAGTVGAAVGPTINPAGPVGAAVGPAAGAALVFYMHDIVGGTNPSAVAITGIVQNPAVSGSVPFAKPNGAVLPVNNGVPQNNNNGGIVSNNNVPFFTGLAGNTANLLQNSNNGGNNNFIAGGSGFPFINGAQLPPGMTLQKLMFGTMTAFDDELTESHDLGSGLMGKAQGFYVASSVDGTSQTMAFTAMFKSGGYEDTLTFFGVHMTAAAESHLAVMGGTGKFLNAKGFATVKTFPPSLDQHNTDGIETLLQFTVYLV